MLFREAEEAFPHLSGQTSWLPMLLYALFIHVFPPSRFCFADFFCQNKVKPELHKYAFRDLTERQRKDKHPYTISRHHPSISHIFITPPQRRQPVETQNLASHEKVSTNHTCNNQTVIIIFPTREAQPIASQTHDNQSPASALLACETQDFASLLIAGSEIKQQIMLCYYNGASL